MWARMGLILCLVAAGARPASQTKKLRLAGQTSARRYYNIVAPMLGARDNRPLELIYLVKAGTTVKKGQTIAQLDARSGADEGLDAADQVKQAKSKIAGRKAEQAVELETLQQSLVQAKSDIERAKVDGRQAGNLTEIERELLRLNQEEAEARYGRLQETVKLQRASFDAEIRIMELTSERQQRQQDRYTRDLSQFVLRAPMDGLAVMPLIVRGTEVGPARQGDQISPGQMFMKIVDVQSMQLEARANQAESNLLHVGQSVGVRLDAFPKVALVGRIYSIGALAVSNGGQNYYVRNIAVNIAIEGSDPKLVPDLAASGDVVLE